MPTHKVTHEILNAALLGFEEQKKHIDAQIVEIRQMMGGEKPSTTMPEPTVTPGPLKRRRRKMSAAGRKAIAQAQRKRWAALKGQAESSPATPEPSKPKRKLSAAGRKAISEATKKRWAAKRAATVKAAPAVAKRSAAKAAPVKKVAKKTGGKGPQKKAKAPEQTAPAVE